MGRVEREQQLRRENRAMKSALSAIHDSLHANQVDRAHELCEYALAGDVVKQQNLSVSDSAKAVTFAMEFNRLSDRFDVKACCVLVMPISSDPNAVSVQLLGNVSACKLVESLINGETSIYMGDHGEKSR